MAVNLPACPASLKPIAHFLKCAQEHDNRDPVVSYWARLHAVQVGLKMSTKQADETSLLIAIMGWLETAKKENAANEAITSEVVAQAHLENYALKLFTYADQHDRASSYGKNVVKSFYTAGLIYDILLVFGELSDEAQNNGKYAKWKAAYIHNCLKNGETPVPGPLKDDDEDEGLPNSGASGSANDDGNGGSSSSTNTIEPLVPPSPAQYPPGSATNFDVSTLPSPPVDPETKNPGGFQPYEPPPASTPPATSAQAPPPAMPWSATPVPAAGSIQLTPDQLIKAQKYCKWAGSALTYEDISTAIENLQKGLHLLQFGQEL